MNLASALSVAQKFLRQFFSAQDSYQATIATSFGTQYDRTALEALQEDIRAGRFETLPAIEILPQIQMGAALGAYAKATDTIYLADRFLANAPQDQVVAVLLEEMGHAIDARINREEAPGDEGAIFSALVRGIRLTAQQLASLRAENDWFSLNLGDRVVAAEAATPEFTSATSFSILENTTAAGTVTATDPDLENLTTLFLDPGIQFNGEAVLNGNIVVLTSGTSSAGSIFTTNTVTFDQDVSFSTFFHSFSFKLITLQGAFMKEMLRAQMA